MTFRFDPDRHEYWLGDRRLPSVTQIMKPLTDPYLSRIPPDVLERKRLLGKAVDAAITMDVQGTLDEESAFSASWAGYFMAWRTFCAQKGIGPGEIWHAQKSAYHPQWMYAGTPDLELLIDGEWSVLDVKCTYELYPTVKIQTAAYSEIAGPEVTRRYSLLLKEDGRYGLEEHTGDDFGVFLALLTIHNWRAKHGY